MSTLSEKFHAGLFHLNFGVESVILPLAWGYGFPIFFRNIFEVYGTSQEIDVLYTQVECVYILGLSVVVKLSRVEIFFRLGYRRLFLWLLIQK